MTLLIFLSSCALLQGEKSLKDFDQNKLLEAIQLTGEGRGRITLGESQYLFGFESALDENYDWILGVEIPLHGEEIMILSDLRKKDIKDPKVESFELRIAKDYRRLKLNNILSTKEFIREFRSLVRFNESKKLGLKPICTSASEDLLCELDGEKYVISSTAKEFFVKKELKQGAMIVLSGAILTNSIFERTNLRLYSQKENFEQKKSALSLELFWKN